MDPSTITIDENKHEYTCKKMYKNLSFKELSEYARRSGNGFIRYEAKTLIVDSGNIKGRLPNDKYIVETKYAKKNIWWSENGSNNKKLKKENWMLIKKILNREIATKNIFIIDGFYNYDEVYSISVRLITTEASAAYFFKLISIIPSEKQLELFEPQWIIRHVPEIEIDNYLDLNLNSSKIIATNIKHRESILIGTMYLAEINKVLLSVISYYSSFNNIGVFYCAVSVDYKFNSTMFFGVSGSGKTTLALDQNKNLVSNEVITWTEMRGMYSLESGLTIKASSFNKNYLLIKDLLRSNLLIENPNFDNNKNIIFGKKNDQYGINTYITIPRENFNNLVNTNNPSTIIFLVKDARGVLPRVAKLSKGQAIYYFLSGYTSISSGLEAGVREPKEVFTSCYAQSFLLLKPTRYANILRQRLKYSDAKIYMINVGWIEGNYKTGRRVPIEETKSIVTYLLSNSKNINLKFNRQKYFNFKTLISIHDDDDIFFPKNLWNNEVKYKKELKSLAKAFIKNYQKFQDDDFAFKYKKFEPSL